MTCLSTHPSTPFKYCVLQTGNVKCIPDGNQRLLSSALGETEVGEAPGCEGGTLERLMGAGKCQKRSTENTVACCCDLLAGWHRGFCTRKKQRGKGSVKNPASGCPTGVRACTLMATREGRPLSRGTRRWKPFLGFWREMVARWWEPTHQQCSLNQAFPGRELIGGQKGKREVNTYLPEIQGEIAGKGDPTMSKHVTVIVCEAQHGGGRPRTGGCLSGWQMPMWTLGKLCAPHQNQEVPRRYCWSLQGYSCSRFHGTRGSLFWNMLPSGTQRCMGDHRLNGRFENTTLSQLLPTSAEEGGSRRRPVRTRTWTK